MSTVKTFISLYNEMLPNMPRVRKISVSHFKKADEETQVACLSWLQAIHATVYNRLVVLLKDLTEEQWELRMRLYPDLEEVVLRRQYEKELQLLWNNTIPAGLLRQQSKASQESSEQSERGNTTSLA